MSVRSLIVLSALALGGCYDLSDPSGPTAEDFARENASAAASQNSDDSTGTSHTAATANCPDGACPAASTPATVREQEVSEQAIAGWKTLAALAQK